MITFENPLFLYLGMILPLVVVYHFFIYRPATFRYSTFRNMPKTGYREFVAKHLPFFLRLLAIGCVVLALARPQIRSVDNDIKTEGVDIVIVLDVSRSMRAEDFQPANRLEVAKEEAHKFIEKRPNDRIGVVVFAQQAITQCPLTLDHNVLLSLLSEVQIGKLKSDGTAIGIALGTAINRLIDSPTKSKIIILLTDGENNAGQIAPLMAADLAHQFGIRVYTIGVGKEGKVPFPRDDPILGRSYSYTEVRIDEEVLRNIAEKTDGLYFRARDQAGLEEVYSKIDSLEKSEIEMTSLVNNKEVFHFFLIPFLFLFLAEIVTTYIFIMQIP